VYCSWATIRFKYFKIKKLNKNTESCRRLGIYLQASMALRSRRTSKFHCLKNLTFQALHFYLVRDCRLLSKLIQTKRTAKNTLTMESRTGSARCGHPVWWLRGGLTTPHRKEPTCYETLNRVTDSADSCSIKGEKHLLSIEATIMFWSRSQWQRRLRRRSFSLGRGRSWGRIPLKTWLFRLSVLCFPVQVKEFAAGSHSSKGTVPSV
jgi:hypothetical protein